MNQSASEFSRSRFWTSILVIPRFFTWKRFAGKRSRGQIHRQTGGLGNYGHCKLRVEPNERGKGYGFINEAKSALVPGEYVQAIDLGVQAALKVGPLAGYPIVDVRVVLYDGSYHEKDSNEMAFKFAGSIAL